jgi:acetyl esterase/lipase
MQRQWIYLLVSLSACAPLASFSDNAAVNQVPESPDAAIEREVDSGTSDNTVPDAGLESIDSGTGVPDGGTPVARGCGVTTSFSQIDDVAYASADGEQKINLKIPDGVGPFPLVIYLHGGGWRQGSYADSSELEAVASRGFVYASVGYRLSGKAVAPAQINDVKAAVRFLKAQAAKYKIDPARVSVSGSSAGGHLAALVGTSADVKELEDTAQGHASQSSRVQVVVDFFGPTDFTLMDAQEKAQGCSGGQPHNSPDSPESKLLGCAVQSCSTLAQRQNPLTYVTADDPPFYLVHGSADCTVPWAQSEMLHVALKSAGIASTFEKIAKAGHGPGIYNMATMNRVYGFLEHHLKGCPLP